MLEAGDLAPADARLLSSANLRVEEAALTGESVPVEKAPDITVSEGAGVGDRRNMVHMGTIVVYGHGEAVVTDTGMNTQLGRIADMIQTVEHETPLRSGWTGWARCWPRGVGDRGRDSFLAGCAARTCA